MSKRYKRVMREDPATGTLHPCIRVTETKVKVRFISIHRLQQRKQETQAMLDALE
jgi:uncharacterized protein (DUF302 family)